MERLVAILSGVAVPAVLLVAGGYFLWQLGRRFLCHPRRLLRRFQGAGEGSDATSVRALTVALAGTLGVGNIAGVASAVVLGGPGAVFWMWMAALLAMPLKYAEVTLALRHRVWGEDGRWHGGAMYYVKEAFRGGAGRILSFLFALLCALCALTLGGMLQANAAAEALSAAFSWPRAAVGGVMAALAALLLLSGSCRVEEVCTFLVPLMCLLFAAASLAVLYLRRAALPSAFAAIFRGAFTVRGCVGGAVGGFGVARALRYGVARGLVSNEAGCGTAPIAHASANVRDPMRQGLFGVVEVVVDTLLLCTLTALVILVGAPITESGEGVAVALSAYAAVLGDMALPILALCIAFFAFATVLCWSHYGRECLGYLMKKRGKMPLSVVMMALAVLFGALFAPAFVWEMTDLTLGCMTLLNVTALLWLRHRVLEISELPPREPPEERGGEDRKT